MLGNQTGCRREVGEGPSVFVLLGGQETEEGTASSLASDCTDFSGPLFKGALTGSAQHSGPRTEAPASGRGTGTQQALH